MDFVHVSIQDAVAEVRLQRGKVNALNGRVIAELQECFRRLAGDGSVRASVLTGTGKFFSFGFDIPEFLGFSREAFTGWLEVFTGFYRELFAHPKPVVAAINGHAVAGGCMIATACDARIMVSGKARIGLNEIGFGSSVFAGSAALLAHWVGQRHAQEMLYSGTLYPAEDAAAMGLVDAVVSEEALPGAARTLAARHGEKDPAAFRSVKEILHVPVLEEMAARERASIREFVEIWYSEQTWKRLREIRIHA